LTNIGRQTTYAYLVTLLGVVLVAITTLYTSIRSFMFAGTIRSRLMIGSGNFTGGRPFGNFTGARQIMSVNPFGGFISDLAILGVIIAIVGLVWLGLALTKSRKGATS
jgi:hypothetical protein